MMGSRLNLDLLFRVPNVLEFDLSPDGKTAAVCWNKSGQYEIYELSSGKDAEQLTSPPESKLAPRYAPEGSRLVFAQDYQGDECFDIFLQQPGERFARNLTPNSPESIYPYLRWSPDGKHLAFASNRSEKFSIYTMPAGEGEPKLLCQHEYPDYNPEWSPDGSMIAFTSQTTGQDFGVFIASLKSGEVLRLSDGGKPVESSQPAWSPDRRSIAFVSAERGMADIGIYSLQDGGIRWVTDGEYECEAPVWSPKGDKLAYVLNLDGNFLIQVSSMDGEKAETIQLAPGIHSEPHFLAGGTELYFLYNGPKNPNDLWKYSFVNGQFTQLTKSLPPTLDTSRFVSPTPVSYSSSDGTKVPALLYAAKRDTGSQRAIIYIHGGPPSQSTSNWSPLLQEFVDQGWTVLAPNYRGSTGYGREFREANRFVMGRLDLDDVVKGADFLVKGGYAEQGGVGITGGSFGGYLTMCALARYPDLWAVGSAIVPFLNWFTEMQNEREDLQYWDRQNMGDPEKDKERLREASPIFFIDRVKAPVQMIAGAHDPRCPVSETMQARDELRRLGKDANVVIYEDEGHGFRKLDNRVDAYKKSVSFLSRHLARMGLTSIEHN